MKSPSRRIALSLNRAQALWLERLLAALRRGAYTREMILSIEATAVTGVIYRASKRAEKIDPRVGPRVLTECRHGHAYTPENTRFTGVRRNRRCWTCTRAAWDRARAKKLAAVDIELKAEAAE